MNWPYREQIISPNYFTVLLSVAHLSWIMHWKSGGSKEVHQVYLHWGKLRLQVQENQKEM